MIPIFRKMRKKMANDNKPLKYLRYAFGEIILVVIGILIAIQLNSVKQNKDKRTEEINYLENILSDLNRV